MSGKTNIDRGRAVVIMDEAMKEYLESWSRAPVPSQLSLDAMFRTVRRARVIKGATSRGKALGEKVLFDTRDASSINSLGEALSIVEGRESGHCLCRGSLTLELHDDERVVAAIELHDYRKIRWNVWNSDAWLRDPDKLVDWLAEGGVPGPKRLLEEARRAAQKELDARQAAAESKVRWEKAIPDCLVSYWGDMQNANLDMDPIRRGLLAAHPNPRERALLLFRWLGSSNGPWNGAPSHESVPELLLLEFPTRDLGEWLSTSELSFEHMQGATRYFAAWRFSQKKPGEASSLPDELKRTLVAHSHAAGYSDDKLYRVSRAFCV